MCLYFSIYSGFLQAHVSYLDESCQTCLFLLTVDRDSFFTLSECKSKIKQVGNFPVPNSFQIMLLTISLACSPQNLQRHVLVFIDLLVFTSLNLVQHKTN